MPLPPPSLFKHPKEQSPEKTVKRRKKCLFVCAELMNRDNKIFSVVEISASRFRVSSQKKKSYFWLHIKSLIKQWNTFIKSKNILPEYVKKSLKFSSHILQEIYLLLFQKNIHVILCKYGLKLDLPLNKNIWKTWTLLAIKKPQTLFNFYFFLPICDIMLFHYYFVLGQLALSV